MRRVADQDWEPLMGREEKVNKKSKARVGNEGVVPPSHNVQCVSLVTRRTDPNYGKA